MLGKEWAHAGVGGVWMTGRKGNDGGVHVLGSGGEDCDGGKLHD
jgi:hypothetical protein